MGGVDKGLIPLRGQPLIQHVITAITPQVGQLVINANRNADRYAGFGYPVIPDSQEGFQGPLAGFLTAMKTIDTPDMVTIPCDGPLLPDNLVERLITARRSDQSDIAVAHDGERLQPIYALMPVSLQSSLQRYLDAGERKIDRWYGQHRVSYVDFSDIPETFVNINTPDDRDRLQDGRSVA
jgi:molybdopterin-guanine dinucleotide biosynthesis protein A